MGDGMPKFLGEGFYFGGIFANIDLLNQSGKSQAAVLIII
jgi:transcriptional regulator of nitric oxide reductase